MASETRSRSATRASGGREVICRLRRGYHSHLPWCGRRRDDGGDLRRGIGSQQLQLLRGDWHAGFGRLDRRPHAHLRVSGGRARDHRPRQSEVGHHQSLPLRAECQSDVRGDYLGCSFRAGQTSVVLKAGRLTSALGSFPLRYDDVNNPLLDQPLQYISQLSLTANQRPCGVKDLTAQEYGAVWFGCGGVPGWQNGLTPVTLYGLAGVEADISGYGFDGRAQETNAN